MNGHGTSPTDDLLGIVDGSDIAGADLPLLRARALISSVVEVACLGPHR
jgi:hypothetical protein